MKSRIARLLVLCGLIASAYNYCPPGASAAPEAPAAMDCCRHKAAKSDCPQKSKHATQQRSCCTLERTAAQDHSKLAAAPILICAVVLVPKAPQAAPHRLVRSLVRTSGPPGSPGFSPASLGNRAPPLA